MEESYYIGLDIGSSSVKAALISASDGAEVYRVQSPDREMPISAPETGWGEQDPEQWWHHTLKAIRELLQKKGVPAEAIAGVGISYQMHGLVMVDKDLQTIRPAIIWSDSRAIGQGAKLLEKVGEKRCRKHLLNTPGNFTLSKLLWVKEHEPALFKKLYKAMLPGDYIAMRFSGRCTTTASGLSEGIMWDFPQKQPAWWLLEAAGVAPEVLPELVPTFGQQAEVQGEGAVESGLRPGTPILYRAGDQPNNALSLNVMQPGEVAATGGTSGVVYAVSDQLETGEIARINNFAHVNHLPEQPRIGKLLCINGTGIQYNWIRQWAGGGWSYPEMNQMAEEIPVGAQGLRVYPFGNGAERMLNNATVGGQISGLDFNIHQGGHLFRAALEGIAFAFVYGMEIMSGDGLLLNSIRAGNDNLFRARPFAETIATLTGAAIEMLTTTGAAGAGRAAGIAAGRFASMEEATATDRVDMRYEPLPDKESHLIAYREWKDNLNKFLKDD